MNLQDKVKQFVEDVVYYILLFVYYPFYFFMSLMLQKEIFTFKLKRLFNIRIKSTIGHFGFADKFLDVTAVSTEHEIDFLRHRGPGYIERMTLWTPRELAKLFVGNQKVSLISDGQLKYVLLSTMFAHALTWDTKRKMFAMSFRELNQLNFFPGFNFSARHVWFNNDLICIEMDNGVEYYSRGSYREDYELAKLHLQVCLTFHAPGLAHNYVHFGIPGTMSVLSRELLGRSSVLYNLITPHLRFTERINYQALHVGKATSNRQNPFQRFFFPRQWFPITTRQFVDGLARKCSETHDSRFNTPLTTPPVPDKDDGLNGSMKVKETEAPNKNTSYQPTYLNSPHLRKIPYLNFLAAYYTVIRKFVSSLEPHIDKDEWKLLAKHMSRYIPDYDKLNVVDALTSVIHQTAVVHFCDHQSFMNYFSQEYGCMTMRYLFIPFTKNPELWEKILKKTKLLIEDVRKNPACLLNGSDVMKLRCFQNIFVDYIPTKSTKMRLVDIEYNFKKHPGLNHLTCKFFNDLHALDCQLKMKSPVIKVEKTDPKDIRAEGLQILPLKDIIGTICF